MLLPFSQSITEHNPRDILYLKKTHKFTVALRTGGNVKILPAHHRKNTHFFLSKRCSSLCNIHFFSVHRSIVCTCVLCSCYFFFLFLPLNWVKKISLHLTFSLSVCALACTPERACLLSLIFSLICYFAAMKGPSLCCCPETHYLAILHQKWRIKPQNWAVLLDKKKIKIIQLASHAEYPKEKILMQNIPNRTILLQNIPNQTVLVQNIQNETTLMQNIPNQTFLLQNIPNETTLMQNIPNETTLMQNIPNETTLMQNIPNELSCRISKIRQFSCQKSREKETC